MTPIGRNLAILPKVGQFFFKQSINVRLTTTKQYDYLNRLQSINSAPSAAAAVGYAYSYNDANQRTRLTLADGSYWVYQYDALGQVKSGKRYWVDGSPVPGQQFEYGFDDIGNRTGAKMGGDQNGVNLQSASYAVNSLNQYTSRTVPGVVPVLGLATPAATVSLSLNSGAATAVPYRRGEYFWKETAVNNTGSPQYPNFDVTAVNGGSSAPTVSGKVFLAKTPEVYDDLATTAVNEGYDLDGNQLRDGRWTYTWDAENRLVAINPVNGLPAGADWRFRFGYDAKGRRITKTSEQWNGSAWVLISSSRFVYDGWNLLAELTTANAVVRSYVWGLDLSGSLQGAGGVGGLVEVNDTVSGAHFVAYDGNGNVSALVAVGPTSGGTVTASYEYGPFGELVRSSGAMAKLNPFRFSTKYEDDQTDHVYYGYRYYNSSPGRWLNRDLIEENGGLNLYGFLANSAPSLTDSLGLEQFQIWASAYIPHTVFLLPYPQGLDPFAIWFGDSRTTAAVGGSSRAYHLLTIETDPNKSPVIANKSGAGITAVIYHPPPFRVPTLITARDVAPPRATVSRTASGCVTVVEFSANTSNPLVAGAPQLHYSYIIRFNVASGRVTISGDHGRFPAFDLIINGKPYVNYVPAGIDDTPLALFRENIDVDASGAIRKYRCCSK